MEHKLCDKQCTCYVCRLRNQEYLIKDLRRELAEANQKIADLQSLYDSTSGLYKHFEAEAGRLREVCHEAWVDIGQWCQLARYQREKMDQNLGWCPTQAGIDASTAVKEKISAALATPAADAGGEVRP